MAFSPCRSDYSWPTSSPVSVVPRKHTGGKLAGYLGRWRCSLFTSLPFQDECVYADINLLCIYVCIRQITDDWQSSSILFWEDFVSLNHPFHAFRSGYLLQGKLLEISIFLCSGRQSFTMVFHELDLEIFSYCLPIPQALWPGIAPLSM